MFFANILLIILVKKIEFVNSSKILSLKHLIKYSLIFLVFHSCKVEIKNIKEGVLASNAMVVSAREEASKIGIEILKKGGNAFDAMMATELALAVSYPSAGNIGGGGFMVFRKSDGTVGALDFRERAPLNSYKDMYLDESKNIIEDLSTIGALSIGVPGTIAGIFEAHKMYGTLTINEIISPVIKLARNGIVVTKNQKNRIDENRKYFKQVNKSRILYDDNFKINEKIINDSLANTIENIMLNGKD